jgi:hypothetical protein
VVTGNKTTELSFKVDSTLNRETLKNCHTVLSLSWTGFSVLVSDANKQKILLSGFAHWYSLKNISDLTSLIDKLLDQIPLSLDQSASLRCLVNFRKFSLVPEHLYEKGKGPGILSYTARLETGDHIYTDHWKSSQAMMIYAAPSAFSQWIKQRFPQAILQHSSSAIERLYQLYPSQEFSGYLHISPGEADFYLAQKGKMQWYNTFQYQTEEDLLYFVLYCLEQNHFQPNDLHLKVGGFSLKGDKLRTLLERYISDVKDLEIPAGYQLITQITEQEIRQIVNLLGAL